MSLGHNNLEWPAGPAMATCYGRPELAARENGARGLIGGGGGKRQVIVYARLANKRPPVLYGLGEFSRAFGDRRQRCEQSDGRRVDSFIIESSGSSASSSSGANGRVIGRGFNFRVGVVCVPNWTCSANWQCQWSCHLTMAAWKSIAINVSTATVLSAHSELELRAARIKR